MLSRILASAMSPSGRWGALSILIFHRVYSNHDPLFPEGPDRQRFDSILRWLKRSFNVVPLSRGIEGLTNGSLPSRAISITFDDGYADNYTLAMPALVNHGLSATFFISTGFLNGGRMWNDTVVESLRNVQTEHIDLSSVGLGCFPVRNAKEKREAINVVLPKLKYLDNEERSSRVDRVANICGASLPDDLMMSFDQVRQMHTSGMEIGAHTINHPILARTTAEVAMCEIVDGKRALEEIVGNPARFFAYPNGQPGRDYTDAHVDMVQEAGFLAAMTTAAGAARWGADNFQLPRFTPWNRTEAGFSLRLIDNMRRRCVLP